MSRRKTVSLLLLPLLTLLTLTATTRSAEPDLTVLDASVLEDPSWGTSDARPINVIVALDGPTTLDLYLARHFAVGDTRPKAQRALDAAFERVAMGQAPARAAVSRTGATILSTYDTVLNGFLVTATPTQIASMTHAPGVRRVYRAPDHEPALADAVPHVGAEEVIEDLGLTGRGVRIAIIDTGIDYFHRSLGGSGKAKDFADDDPDTLEDRDDLINGKVVGGWDFAGTNYNSIGNASQRQPKPDIDPRDELGHGSHVAGIAAGAQGVTAVHHGAAPDALLIALKVFGGLPRSATNLANDAIEWAVEANLGRDVPGECQPDQKGLCRVDVINLSLGSAFAGQLPEASDVVRRATEAGIIVVASSGNANDVAFITGSPGAAPHAVSVANTWPPGETHDLVKATYENADHDVEAMEAHSSLSKQMQGQRDVRGDLIWFGSGCPGGTPPDSARRMVALLDPTTSGGCTIKDKAQAAEDAGAAAAIVHLGNDNLGRLTSQTGAVDIPVYAVTRTDGLLLKRLLDEGTEIEILLSAQFRDAFPVHYIVDTVAGSSSRGPSRGGGLKPDLAAPGSNIRAPRAGSGNQAVTQSGTSMSSPLVAGAAALVVQRVREDGLAPDERPLDGTEGLGALDVAALLVNYATEPVWERDTRLAEPAPLARGGAGRVDVAASVRGETLVRAGTIGSLSLGFEAVTDTFEDVRTLTVHNLGATVKHYQADTTIVMADDVDAGVRFSLTPTEFSVGAGESADVELSVSVDAAALKPYRVYGGQRLLSAASGAVTGAEMDALVTVTEVDAEGEPVADGDAPQVPVYFLPRPATHLSASPVPVRVDPGTGQGTTTLRNAGRSPGPAELFTLLADDEIEDDVDSRLNIDLVGVRVEDGPGSRAVSFAIHTTGARVIPHEAAAQIFVDADRDGQMDVLFYNIDPGAATQGVHNGQQRLAVFGVTGDNPLRLGSGIVTSDYPDVDVHSRTMIMRIPAARLGLGSTGPIAFDAVVRMLPAIEDVRGDAASMKAYDVVPDNGWLGGGLGEGRLTFDSAAAAATPHAWTVALDGGARETLTVTLPQGGASPSSDELLAVYPMNPPGDGDAQRLRVESGSAPPLVTPTPTAPSRPERSVFLPGLLRRGSY